MIQSELGHLVLDTPYPLCACQHATHSLTHARTKRFQNTLTIPSYHLFFLFQKLNIHWIKTPTKLSKRFSQKAVQNVRWRYFDAFQFQAESAWNRRYVLDENQSKKYYAPNVLTSNSTNQLLQKFLCILAIVGFFFLEMPTCVDFSETRMLYVRTHTNICFQGFSSLFWIDRYAHILAKENAPCKNINNILNAHHLSIPHVKCVSICAPNTIPPGELQSLLLHKYSFAQISVQFWPKFDLVFVCKVFHTTSHAYPFNQASVAQFLSSDTHQMATISKKFYKKLAEQEKKTQNFRCSN